MRPSPITDSIPQPQAPPPPPPPPLPPRSNSPRITARASPAPSTSSSSVWKLSLPSLTSASADRSRPSTANANRDATTSQLTSSPSPAPMSSLANALAMKKRLSDSITDSWSRRRPSLPQGATPPTILPGSSRYNNKESPSNGTPPQPKSRSRALSAATPTPGVYSRTPPSLSASTSLATIASTTSSNSSSSHRGGLSRRDSYSDVIGRGYVQPPLASIPSRSGTPGGEGLTIALPLKPSRNVSSQPIANPTVIRQAEVELEFQGGYWEDPLATNCDPAIQAAADVGMRRVGVGLTRKISDSRRIMSPLLDKEGGGVNLEEDVENENTIPLGAPRNTRESGGVQSSSTYDLSSDEESTSSSVGTKSTSDSAKAGTMPFSSPKNKTSRVAGYPSQLEMQTSAARPSTAHAVSTAVVDRHMAALSRPQSSTGYLSRLASASPQKPGTSSMSARARPQAALDIPMGNEEPGSRLSSLAAKSPSIVSSHHPSPTSSRAPSTIANIVARSDSNSSTASTSTNAQAARTSASSTHRNPVMSRERSAATAKAALAASAIPVRNKARHPPSSMEPPIPDPSTAPKVEAAPASGMYWYKAPTHGLEHKPLRAHTCTLVGSNIYVFGGCDLTNCFNALHVFDADSMSWSQPEVYGEVPPPLRAMTCTAVRTKLVIFGGGDGPTYYNDVYVFDTTTSRFTRPQIVGPSPCRRRAHTACLYKNGIYVFGGGDGVRALNDVWRLDVTDLTKPSWKLISQATTSPSRSNTSALDHVKPTARGYHTANMVGSKLIIFGGSDGEECFKDVWVFDIETLLWRLVEIKKSYSRLSHSATVIGSYLFVVGGHDGLEHSSEVLLLNLVTMQWDRRKVYGIPPSGRGYHCAVLYDSRLFIIGGFDGHRVFNDTYILELAVSSYYSQISHFSVVVNPGTN